MKILYAGTKNVVFRSGETELSFEHIHFYLSLLQIPGVSVEYYNLDRLRETDHATVSREIAAKVNEVQPDFLFTLVNHELDKEIFRDIAKNTRTATVGFYTDEDTNLHTRSQAWMGVFDWSVIFYPPAFDEYKKKNINVLGINWAVNTDFFKPSANGKAPKMIDTSFVGVIKEERAAFVQELAARGIAVSCYGAGWPAGPVDFQKMVEIIASSKINLNIGIGKPIWRLPTLARIFVSPGVGGQGYRFDAWHAAANIRTIMDRRRPMSRARPFELAAVDAFVLTNRNASVFGEPYREGEEMVSYAGARDAGEKITYYLAHDDEREAIARAGYERTVRDHSFKKRFEDIFAVITQDPKPKHPVAKVLT